MRKYGFRDAIKDELFNIAPYQFYKVRWAQVTSNLLYDACYNIDQWKRDILYDYYWAIQPVHQKVGKT